MSNYPFRELNLPDKVAESVVMAVANQSEQAVQALARLLFTFDKAMGEGEETAVGSAIDTLLTRLFEMSASYPGAREDWLNLIMRSELPEEEDPSEQPADE